MRKALITLGAAASLAVPSPAEAHYRHTYATCYNLWGTMADGTQVRPRSVASNVHRLGTRLRLVGPSFVGMRKLVVRDTGSALWDGHLDIWFGKPSGSFVNCAWWGKRTVHYKVGWGKP